MKKLSLLVVASVVAVGSAYACGGDEPAKNPTDVPSATSTSTSTSTASTTSALPSATPSTTASAAPPEPEPPAIVVDGIKLTGKTKDGKPVAVEVKADGAVTKDGKTVASFVKNTIKDDTGKVIFAVDKDGKISAPDLGDKPMAFNEKDEIQVDGKPVITIADDGTPSIASATKTEKAPFKFEKLPKGSKRGAALLVAMMFVAKPVAAPPATSVGPNATASAAPKTTASAAPKK